MKIFVLAHAPRRYLNITIIVSCHYLVHVYVLIMTVFQEKEWIRYPALFLNGLNEFDVSSAFDLSLTHDVQNILYKESILYIKILVKSLVYLKFITDISGVTYTRIFPISFSLLKYNIYLSKS